MIENQAKQFGWKYYQRYPERRITRLNTGLNDVTHGRRLAIVTKARAADGNITYLSDARIECQDENFARTLHMLFGDAVPTGPGAFVQLPVDAPKFLEDAVLSELLALYDDVHSRGWIDTLRVGDTGIGYTFETLVGIKENNDQNADYKGVEIKCKLKRDLQPTAGKINLFQMGPTWLQPQSGIERLRLMGRADEMGLHSCYSQVTPITNNLGLRLEVQPFPGAIDLYKDPDQLGLWARQQLAERLANKHTRALFVKADSRTRNGSLQYFYNEVIYCERPDIERFVDMVENRRIVFEFAMTERPPGHVRNHGYPWRLVDERQLAQLFALQVKLRG
ncbi:MAG: hypothetical protein H0X25_19775 [Acidobacteriales bacterium]|nr:hypothetical protein [Terriglobales bacterium]